METFKICGECRYLVRISGGTYICLLKSDEEKKRWVERHPLEKVCECFEERKVGGVRKGRLEAVKCRL